MNALSGWSDLFCTYKVIFSIPWPKYIDYLRQVFPQFSDSKLKEDIFNLVTNYKIARRYPFYRKAHHARPQELGIHLYCSNYKLVNELLVLNRLVTECDKKFIPFHFSRIWTQSAMIRVKDSINVMEFCGF